MAFFPLSDSYFFYNAGNLNPNVISFFSFDDRLWKNFFLVDDSDPCLYPFLCLDLSLSPLCSDEYLDNRTWI